MARVAEPSTGCLGAAMMTRLVRPEFRKPVTTRVWLWLLLVSAACTAAYSALAISLNGRRPDSHADKGGGAARAVRDRRWRRRVAILAAAGTAGEFRHRTAAATLLAAPRRATVMAAEVVTYLLAGQATRWPAPR